MALRPSQVCKASMDSKGEGADRIAAYENDLRSWTSLVLPPATAGTVNHDNKPAQRESKKVREQT
jgi:hypothetical protein